MGLFTQSVQVTLSATGIPLRLHWQGKQWHVCAEPLRWFERRTWWAEDPRAQRGHGPGLVDHEIWRLQLRLGTRDAPRTVHVSHRLDTGRWRLINLPSEQEAQGEGVKASA